MLPRITVAALLALLAAGCDPDWDDGGWGYDVSDHFPLDGSERVWVYDSLDESVEWTLLVEKTTVVHEGDLDVVTLEHSNDDTLTVLAQVDWSSDSTGGVRIHGYHVEDGDVSVAFDPPIQFAELEMTPGDAVETETGGTTFTSTFETVEGCGTFWAPSWDDEGCLKFTLADGDEDPATNAYIAGSYWLVTRYGPAWLVLDAYPARWSLSDRFWEE